TFSDCKGNDKLRYEVSSPYFKVNSDGGLVALRNITAVGKTLFVHARTPHAEDMAELWWSERGSHSWEQRQYDWQCESYLPASAVCVILRVSYSFFIYRVERLNSLQWQRAEAAVSFSLPDFSRTGLFISHLHQVGQLLERKIREYLSQLSSCWGGNMNVCIDAWVAGGKLTMIDDLCIWRGGEVKGSWAGPQSTTMCQVLLHGLQALTHRFITEASKTCNPECQIVRTSSVLFPLSLFPWLNLIEHSCAACEF
ncbi:hypothetical protein H8959_001207, partial [Pygathrix nigripes]